MTHTATFPEKSLAKTAGETLTGAVKGSSIQWGSILKMSNGLLEKAPTSADTSSLSTFSLYGIKKPIKTASGKVRASAAAKGKTRRGRKKKESLFILKEQPSANTLMQKQSSVAKGRCKECGGELSKDVQGGYLECMSCGLTHDGIISQTQEFHAHGSDESAEDQLRCGAPVDPLMPKTSMCTYFGAVKGRSVGNVKTLRRLQQWGNIPFAERSLKLNFSYIDEHTRNTGVTVKITDDAKLFYTLLYNDTFSGIGGDVQTATFSKGKCRKGLLAACVYKACEKNKFVRTHEQLSNMFKIEVSTLRNGIKRFNKIMQQKNIDFNFSPHTVEDFCRQYCLHFPFRISSLMRDYIVIIAKRVDSLNLIQNNTTKSVATGIISIISSVYNLGINIQDIHKKCKISLMTVKDVTKKLRQKLRYVLPWREYYIYELRKLSRSMRADNANIANRIADLLPSLF
jgi:transcription initiation factor TFIIIB Brf1 subunit/transcription initiation factor TFIIB